MSYEASKNVTPVPPTLDLNSACVEANCAMCVHVAEGSVCVVVMKEGNSSFASKATEEGG